MKKLIVLLCGLLIAGCVTTPIVTVPQVPVVKTFSDFISDKYPGCDLQNMTSKQATVEDYTVVTKEGDIRHITKTTTTTKTIKDESVGNVEDDGDENYVSQKADEKYNKETIIDPRL